MSVASGTLDSFKARQTLQAAGKTYTIWSLKAAAANGLGDISRLPVSLKIMLENLIRFEDGRSVTKDDIKAVAAWLEKKTSEHEIGFRPARVLMQDLTGVPAVVDLAAMRQAMVDLGGDARKINPLSPVDLVIDHSVQVDAWASAHAFADNVKKEYERNMERYEFLRWGQIAFDNFRVVPPGIGICHQVNLEYLAKVVWSETNGAETLAYPDTLFGTDSHTTMVNGLCCLGWGVGGIEAEAAMLGQPQSMVIPDVVGMKLTGARLKDGTTATDLVLTVTQMLRKKGVVGKFVEFYGPGLDALTPADRATVANMAPEYGATCGLFPIDDQTLEYLRFTGRDAAQIALVEAYAKAQGIWRDRNAPDPVFSDTLELDIGTVESSLAGPKRPQDRVALSKVAASFAETLPDMLKATRKGIDPKRTANVAGADYALHHGDVVIAAITSCTNTSNPAVLVGAGLVARKARAKGLKAAPWVKTSLAPGSQVVADYLQKSGMQDDLNALGFNLVGFGCTTCIGNSGPLADPIADAVDAGDLVVGAVISGNRNFEGRVHPQVRANYLASPMLVVAYAIAGKLTVDISKEALGTGSDGKPVYLKDIWPTNREIAETIQASMTPEMFRTRYANVFEGSDVWKAIKTAKGLTYEWNEDSTYCRLPPYFEGMSKTPKPVEDIKGAKLLALFGDSITTDHISPAGSIKKDGPAGQYLIRHQVGVQDFNSYGARRGNHEVMMRGTFANIRIKNELMGGQEGGITKHLPDGGTLSIFDAAMKYEEEKTPLIIVAGKEYGTGSSRDWAAKGTMLLGVRAVIAESFERIHRANLVGMGVVPLTFPEGVDRKTLKIDGSETFDLAGLSSGLKPRMKLPLVIHRADGRTDTVDLFCRIDTLDEVEYYRHGGILPYVLRQLLAA
ncbi:MAG TPA: aconitate hydratase AcnA [Alphaproteobacteria bacterium]|nr:aconitate hydratase AcnA [Alphaproteobacteria bacterium]